MAADILPLKGAIANLNWFDAQRKHYETPDQIARRLPLTTDAAWSYLAEPEKREAWLPETQWNLEVADCQPPESLVLQPTTGGSTQFQLQDATGSARARRQTPRRLPRG